MAEDFIPVEVADDKGTWKPLPPEITAEGPTPTATEIMPPATPTIKGERTPSVKEAQTGIIRYGVPVGVGLATGGASVPIQLLAGGLSTSLSELTARQLERASTDPELDSIWQDIKGAGVAGAMDIGMGALGVGLGHMIKDFARVMLLPKNMPPDVELAQTILGRFKDTASAAARKWRQFKGKDDPFSLTLGQLNNEERGFVTWLEGIARGGTGRGIMSKFDARNVENVSEALGKYFESRTAQMTGPEFGVFVKRVLGTVKDPGEAFKPVEAFRSFLYKRFDDALEAADATVDLSSVQKLLASSKSPELLKMYKSVNAPLPNGDSLLPAITKGDWSKLSATDVDKVLHNFSDYYKAEDPSIRRAAKILKESINTEFQKTVKKVPDAEDMLKAANSYFGAKENALYNSTIKSLRRVIEKKPSGVAAMLDISKGNAAIKYDQLMKLKQGLYFSAATPAETALREPVEKMWENSVLKPLRFRMVDSATDQYGRLDPSKFMQQIEKIEAEAPEALNELWGSPAQVQHIKELASTYQTLQNTVPEKSIFIQLKTAAAVGTLGATAGAGFSFVTGDNPTMGAAIGGAATILLSPIVLAKVLTNSKLTRALTDGLTESSRVGGITSTLAMAFRKMAEMKVASKTFRDAPSQDVMMFYNFAPVEEVQQE